MTIATYATRLSPGSTSGVGMPANGGTRSVECTSALAAVSARTANGGADVRNRTSVPAHARLAADAFIPGLLAWSPPLL